MPNPYPEIKLFVEKNQFGMKYGKSVKANNKMDDDDDYFRSWMGNISIDNIEWDDYPDCSCWQHHVPIEIRQQWKRYSHETRFAIYLMAKQQSDKWNNTDWIWE